MTSNVGSNRLRTTMQLSTLAPTPAKIALTTLHPTPKVSLLPWANLQQHSLNLMVLSTRDTSTPRHRSGLQMAQHRPFRHQTLKVPAKLTSATQWGLCASGQILATTSYAHKRRPVAVDQEEVAHSRRGFLSHRLTFPTKNSRSRWTPTTSKTLEPPRSIYERATLTIPTST